MNRRISVSFWIFLLCWLACCTKEAGEAKPKWKTELVRAIQRDNVAEVQRILSANSSSPAAALNDNSLTPLMVAARAGSREVTGWLLGQGVKVDAGTKAEDGTALLGACDRGFLEIVKLLVEHGANVNHKDSRGWPPLLAAINQNHAAVAEYLVGRSADVNAEFSNKRSALMSAAEGGNASLVGLLLQKGAKINHTNDDGNNALIDAAAAGRAEVVSLLIKEGAQTDLQNEARWTALSKAAALGYCEAVKVLCDAGADPTLPNKFGRTALEYARGITATNNIATLGDVRAAVSNGLISREETYYLLARKGSGRDFDCVVRVLEDYQRRFKRKPEAK